MTGNGRGPGGGRGQGGTRGHGAGWRPKAPDGVAQHREWLSLVEVTGPFLSLPVLRAAWPTLDPLDRDLRDRLRLAHALWLADPAQGQTDWVDFVLADLLGWGDALRRDGLDALAVDVPEHDTTIVPSFALLTPGEDATGPVKPDAVACLGLVCPAGAAPTARVAGSDWAATPTDRIAHACRATGVELGLVTDGRWWALVWAPAGRATTTAVFDAVAWPDAAERHVVRAFVSLLARRRFFGVPDEAKLTALLRASIDRQEDITEALGTQVRKAVELLVAAFGRADTRDRERGGPGLSGVDAHDVYRGAVAVMMRVVFLLFAEERGLLPADNDLYAQAYSAGGLRSRLERRVREGTEEDLEHGYAAWHRLLALFNAVYHGVDHPRLRLHAHDGSIFDPAEFGWLPLAVDDRTVLHMLKAVQVVQVGTGKNREARTLSFRSLDVEQIGYVYEGLLSFEGFRATDVMVGLVGKEGAEDEVPLSDLESLAATTPDVPALAAALADKYKDSGIGSARALAKRLAPLGDAEAVEARKRLLAVTGGKYDLAERLLPFAGIIRDDLRELPVVILPGALYVTESALRRNTGTHYTPRTLAEQVVEGALQPLVYSPGPLQTANESEWVPRSSAELLSLKVADIAMGSAAFLVAAARYLGDKLVDAWLREGDERVGDYTPPGAGSPADADEDPVRVAARRQIIEHCLYGVDINPMAVEMAKLSLWLVSMDPHRPFTFLDDRLVAGDSLLGITSLDQVEVMHVDAAAGRRIHERALLDFTAGVRNLVADVAAERRELAGIDGDGLDALRAKRRLLANAAQRTERVRLFADLTVGAALAHAGRGERGLKDASLAAADLARRITAATPGAEEEAAEQRDRWLATDRPPGAFPRHPLHWPLAFPEVFETGGFDAVIGNPPFLGGQKLSGAMGTAYREYLVNAIGRSARGSADLIAYFALRVHDLLNVSGQTGLIATNTLAQGDTREVGLDQLVASDVTIRRAIKSRPWPSKSAVLEYCAICTSRAPLGEKAERIADGVVVVGVTPSLDAASRVTGNSERLTANGGMSFIGSYVLGMGFTMEPDVAKALINREPRNAEVLFPYLNGQDLNSRPDGSSSRWVINFHDWSEDRAKSYPDCYSQVTRLVKPERDRNNRKVYRDYWWQFAEKRPAMLRAIAGLGRVVVIALVSKTVMPVMVPTGQVFSHMLGVFATEDTATLALLSSAPHYWWAVTHASTMKTDIRYTPSDVFETLPLPELTQEMRELGERLDTFRRELMLGRQAGLTATYNLVHDKSCQDDGIAELRAIHTAIDIATVRAYGWTDLLDAPGGLGHDFHSTGRDTRYTIAPPVRQEVLDRLLELNHTRHAEELAAGLTKKPKRAKPQPDPDQDGLF